MRFITIVFIFLFHFPIIFNAQTVQDDFEGNGTITWEADPTQVIVFDVSNPNQFQEGINTSSTVLKYDDNGSAAFANIRFNIPGNFDLSTENTFSFKIYIPTGSISGTQANQISLKLQDGALGEPWATQSEIIKPVVLDQWQEISFNFESDSYIPTAPDPITRTDFNRVVLQVNGENNNDSVIAYIDDFIYDGTINGSEEPVYDNLVWYDEFDGTGEIDGTKWFHQTKLIAGNSWANGEVQHYTNREANSYMDNGTLKIKAIKETYSDQGVSKSYTSARLNSKFSFKYGRVEVRAKLPSVAGTWPAIWLLGKNINEDGAYWDNEGFGTTSWPWCGEIDIMEPNVAKTEILGTWHWDNGGGYQFNSKSVVTNNTDTSQNFYNYILEWNPDSMKIYMNNILINEMPTVTPFDEEFFILLNVAMGGSLGGNIDNGFTNDIMEIDYVRIYQESPLSIAQEVKNEVRFYPNPVEDKLNIELKNMTNQNVGMQVVDVSGRVIYNKQYVIEDSKISFDASSLNPGLYFINLSYRHAINNAFKFVKK